jgi:hypothetical protein
MAAPAAAPSLRDACVDVLATCLHRMPLATFTSVVWPEECLLLLLHVRPRAFALARWRWRVQTRAQAPDARRAPANQLRSARCRSAASPSTRCRSSRPSRLSTPD